MANDYERRLIRVLDYIHDNPSGDLSLDRLAEIAALSRFHFHRVFHAMTGETAAQTVRRLRMYRAALALLQSHASPVKIATSLGYSNATSFSRSFAEIYGQSPSAFRAKGELRPSLPTFLKRGIPMYPVEIRSEPARALVALPHQGDYQHINRAFEKLGAILTARGLITQARLMVGVYYSDPAATKTDDLRSHAGFEMRDPIAIEAPLESVSLAAGRHAVLRYVGPYSGLKAVYDQLYRDWLPNSGEVPENAPPFEIYLNTPMDTAPEALITEICLPLA